jgi:hypothetical protein
MATSSFATERPAPAPYCANPPSTAGAADDDPTGATLASVSGHPLGSHVHVNSETAAHSSGRLAHAPPVALKHQPQPATGVHVPQLVYGRQWGAAGTRTALLSSFPHAAAMTAPTEASASFAKSRFMARLI